MLEARSRLLCGVVADPGAGWEAAGRIRRRRRPVRRLRGCDRKGAHQCKKRTTERKPAGKRPAKAPRTPPKGGPPSGKATPPTSSRFPDEDGATGPNGLVRREGGNKKGDVCEYISKGEKCPFVSYSFRHEA